MAAWLKKTLGAKIEAAATLAGAGFIAMMGLWGIFVLPDDHVLGKISAGILLFAAGYFFCRGIQVLRVGRG